MTHSAEPASTPGAPPGLPAETDEEREQRLAAAHERERRSQSVTASADPPPQNGGKPPGAAETRVIAARAIGTTPDAARLRELVDEAEARALQGAVEGVVEGDRVGFMGEWFRISDRVGLMPLMKFANSADSDLDTSDMAALAAMYDMLRDSIYGGTETDLDPAIAAIKPGERGYDAGDWRRFERLATKTKAQGDDLVKVVQQVVEILAARPTK